MPDVALLADMNISPRTVSDLSELGWAAIRVNELLPASATDEAILDIARRSNRVVVTQDLDFSALLALRGQDAPSLVSLRTTSANSSFITQRLADALPRVVDQLTEGCIVTIEDVSYRVRRLPIP